MRYKLAAALTAGTIALLASGALAQSAAPATAPAPSGVCVYSEAAVVAASSAAAAAEPQFKTLQQNAVAELTNQRAALAAQAKAVEALKGSPTYKAKLAELQKNAEAYNALAKTRDDQLQHTRAQVLSQIAKASLPLLDAAVAASHCGIVVDKHSTYTFNPAIDLTAQVIQQLNARLPSVPVTLAAAN